jgi:hypothetical protein
MEAVATIAPMSGSHGLVAFLCSACGDAKSDLIPAELWQVNRNATTCDVVGLVRQ